MNKYLLPAQQEDLERIWIFFCIGVALYVSSPANKKNRFFLQAKMNLAPKQNLLGVPGLKKKHTEIETIIYTPKV